MQSTSGRLRCASGSRQCASYAERLKRSRWRAPNSPMPSSNVCRCRCCRRVPDMLRVARSFGRDPPRSRTRPEPVVAAGHLLLLR